MITVQDRNELRKRFKKDGHGITRLCLRYTSSGHATVTEQGDTFGTLPEEDEAKYLDIAKKSLGGTPGDNLMDLNFTSNRNKVLDALLSSGLKDPDVVKELFDGLTAQLSEDGSYLITVLADTYDVPAKGKDKLSQDESETVFSYILISVCPMVQTKPGLGYLPAPDRMGSREKDWVAGPPMMAVMYPAFSERCADTDYLWFYSKDPLADWDALIEDWLGCSPRISVSKCRNAMKEAVQSSPDINGEKAVLKIHEAINRMTEEAEESGLGPIEVTPMVIREAATEALGENHGAEAEAIAKACDEAFGHETPEASLFVDKKAIDAAAPAEREQELLKENYILKEQLKKAGVTPNTTPVKNGEVVIKVPAGTADKVSLSDDGKYVMVPVSGDGNYRVTED